MSSALLRVDPTPLIVIPAEAGIHPEAPEPVERWIPAFAGMTSLKGQAAWPSPRHRTGEPI